LYASPPIWVWRINLSLFRQTGAWENMQKHLILEIAGCVVLELTAWSVFHHANGKVETAPESIAARALAVTPGSISPVLVGLHVARFVHPAKGDIGDRVRRGQTLQVPQYGAREAELVAQVSRSKGEPPIRRVPYSLDCVLSLPSPKSLLMSPNAARQSHPAGSTSPATAWSVFRRGVYSSKLTSSIINL
jgi:hypothetical protein